MVVGAIYKLGRKEKERKWEGKETQWETKKRMERLNYTTLSFYSKEGSSFCSVPLRTTEIFNSLKSHQHLFAMGGRN